MISDSSWHIGRIGCKYGFEISDRSSSLARVKVRAHHIRLPAMFHEPFCSESVLMKLESGHVGEIIISEQGIEPCLVIWITFCALHPFAALGQAMPLATASSRH